MRNNLLDFDKSYYCQNCEYIINRQKHQFDKKIRRQDHGFSTSLPYAKEKIREIYHSMVNTTYNSTEDMIDNLQQLKGKTKKLFYKTLSSFYDEMNKINFRFQEDILLKMLKVLVKFVTKYFYYRILYRLNHRLRV